MNFFEFYDIPVSFNIDKKELKKKYLTLSKKYHPDFFTLASDESQADALSNSTLNNNAYKTLGDFDLRMKYILEINDALSAEGQNKLPQSFLMEMMDVNEEIMELQMDFSDSGQAKIMRSINNFEQGLIKTVEEDLDKYNGQAEFDFTNIKDYYLKKKYLKRLKDNISNIEPEI